MSKSNASVEKAKKILGKKRVVFVEGLNDELVYSQWLAKLNPLYAGKLELIRTGGLDQGLQAITELSAEPEVFALLDRDQMDSSRLAASKAITPRLLVNEARHCLENYFCSPTDIEISLLNHDSNKYSGVMSILSAALDSVRLMWVDHWAMWTTAMRLQIDMVSEGYSHYFHKVVPLPDDTAIQARIATWSGLVEKDKIFAEFEALRTNGRSRSPDEQYRSCMWGKRFFPLVVLPALNAIEKRTDWLIDLASWCPSPPDDLLVHLNTLLT